MSTRTRLLVLSISIPLALFAVFVIPASADAQEATSSITVISPNGGGQWAVGSTQTITWLGVSTGNISLIALKGELGGEWHLVYNTPNDSSEIITVPDLAPGRYKISLNTDIINGKIIEDQSDNYFNIVSSTTLPSITVLSPNGGEQLVQGKPYEIKWSGGKDKVQVGLVRGDFKPADSILGWITVTASPSSSVSWDGKSVCDLLMSTCWSVSSLYPGPYKITVVSADNLGNYCIPCNSDLSDAPFNIVSSTTQLSITVLSPNGGETWVAGQTYKIAWKAANINKVVLSVCKESFCYSILGTNYLGIDASLGKFGWTISDTTAPYISSDKLKIKVVDSSHCTATASSCSYTNSIFDESDNYFGIVSASTLVASQKLSVDLKINGLDTPKGVPYNSIFTVSWTSTGAVNCAAYGHFIPAVEGGIWTDFKNLPSVGSKNLYARHQTFDYLSALLVGIQCFDNKGTSVADEISFSVEIPSAAIVLTAPEMAYPKDRQILDLEGSYMFKVEPMKGASGYSLELYQGGGLLYNSELEYEGGLNTIGEFAIHPDNPVHAKFRTGDVEVVARTKIGEKWSEESVIIITLKPRKIEFSQKKEHCLPEGTLIKSPDDPKVYIIRDCKKEWVKTAEEFQRGGYEWDDVRSAADPIIDAYADYLLATANLLKAVNEDRVYRIVEGKKLWIPSAEAFKEQKLDWNEVRETSLTELAFYPAAKLLRARSDPKVYFITDSGLKKWIRTAEIFASYSSNRWGDVVEVEPEVINSFSDAQLIKFEGDFKVYKLENNQKQWVKTVEAFLKNNFNWNNIVTVNKAEFNYYSEGKPIE